MTSATYTQSSLDRADALAVDSENRLLWKQNRRRLEFEPLHDSLLATSGQLDPKLGGQACVSSARTRAARYTATSIGWSSRRCSLRSTCEPRGPHAGAHKHNRCASGAVPDERAFCTRSRQAADRNPRSPEAHRPGDRLDLIYLTVYGRRPDADEKKLALAFVSKGADRWADLAHACSMTTSLRSWTEGAQ